MHKQPHTSRPSLTLREASHFARHHHNQMIAAILVCDARMARFHQMRADYLNAAIAKGIAK